MFQIIISHNTDVEFSPNGKYLATSGENNLVRIWKTDTWEELPSIKHEHRVQCLAFSPDNQYIATSSKDKTSIWQISNLGEIARITNNCYVNSIQFSSDGKHIATAHQDGNAKVWLWRKEDLINEACNRLNRNLTLEEWQQYMDDEPYRKICLNID